MLVQCPGFGAEFEFYVRAVWSWEGFSAGDGFVCLSGFGEDE